MVRMAALHDPKETCAHVKRVSAFSAEIYQHWAEKKQLPAAEVKYFRDLISLAAMLHDAGKVGISDIILKKPAKLTNDEFRVLKKHTIFPPMHHTTSTLYLMRKTTITRPLFSPFLSCHPTIFWWGLSSSSMPGMKRVRPLFFQATA